MHMIKATITLECYTFHSHTTKILKHSIYEISIILVRLVGEKMYMQVSFSQLLQLNGTLKK